MIPFFKSGAWAARVWFDFSRAAEFFQIAMEDDEDQLMQDFLDEYYGVEGESIDIANLSNDEIDDIADEFYSMYGYDPRVSYNSDDHTEPSDSLDSKSEKSKTPATKSSYSSPAKKNKVKKILKRLRKR